MTDTRSTVTRCLFDNDERHVTVFRPISEATHIVVHTTKDVKARKAVTRIYFRGVLGDDTT